MADGSRNLSITYSSGLIPPPEYMSTLAEFYDEIWLPAPLYTMHVEEAGIAYPNDITDEKDLEE